MESRDEKNNTEIERAIVSAIAFFDMFDYPLTEFEIWKFIKLKCTLSDVQSSLRDGKTEKIEQRSGFYFLRNRGEIIETRLKRYVYADRKFKRAMRVVKIFKFIPWIEMIGFSNIIGANNLRDGSDIDIFIITKNKKIWITRFFCTTIAQVLGLRPKKGNERDKICLNFYISNSAMNIKSLMLRGNDIYFKYWLINLIPIYNVNNTYNDFIKDNIWIKEVFPNWDNVQVERRRNIGGNNSWFNLFNIFNNFELSFKKLQLKMMPNEMKELTNKDSRVVINDSVLKLHINDRREKYRRKYESY